MLTATVFFCPGIRVLFAGTRPKLLCFMLCALRSRFN